MAIRHVITRGYGFSGGTAFIPTRGYTPSQALPAVSGPYYIDIASHYLPGSAAAESYVAGAAAIDDYLAGAVAAETR